MNNIIQDLNNILNQVSKKEFENMIANVKKIYEVRGELLDQESLRGKSGYHWT